MAKRKNLGEVQEAVLRFIAEQPLKNKEQIQNGIGHKNYQTIWNAVDALTKTGYLDYQMTKSEKNLDVKIYTCSEKGIIYVLQRATQDDGFNIMKTNSSKFNDFNRIIKAHDKLEYALFSKLYNALLKAMMLSDESGNVKSSAILAYVVQNSTKKELKKISKVFMEIDPNMVKVAKELRSNLDDLLEDFK